MVHVGVSYDFISKRQMHRQITLTHFTGAMPVVVRERGGGGLISLSIES